MIAKLMQEKGWTLTGPQEIYPTGTTDFSMGLLKAKREGAQVILIWMDMSETAILLKQMHDLRVPALALGASMAAAEQPGFWQATAGKGEYALVSVVNAGNAPSRATPWTREGAVGTIFQWQNGKRVAVYPFSIAAGEVRLPPGFNRR